MSKHKGTFSNSLSNILLESYYDLCDQEETSSYSCDDYSSDSSSSDFSCNVDSSSSSCSSSSSSSDYCMGSFNPCNTFYVNAANFNSADSSNTNNNTNNNNSRGRSNRSNARGKSHKHCKPCSSRSSRCSSSSSSSSCTGTNYDVEVRSQFTIVQPSENISTLLQAISNECIEINGYLLQAINCNCTLFSFAIGTADEQSSVNLAIVRCLLKKLCICYLENDILKVTFPTAGPGALADFYCALTSNDISVSTSYPSIDSNSIYIEPSCIEGLCDIL